MPRKHREKSAGFWRARTHTYRVLTRPRRGRQEGRGRPTHESAEPNGKSTTIWRLLGEPRGFHVTFFWRHVFHEDACPGHGVVQGQRASCGSRAMVCRPRAWRKCVWMNVTACPVSGKPKDIRFVIYITPGVQGLVRSVLGGTSSPHRPLANGLLLSKPNFILFYF